MLLPAEAPKFSLALIAEPTSVSGDPKSTLRSSPTLELFISEALRMISDRSEPKLAPLDGGDPIIKLKKRQMRFVIVHTNHIGRQLRGRGVRQMSTLLYNPNFLEDFDKKKPLKLVSK